MNLFYTPIKPRNFPHWSAPRPFFQVVHAATDFSEADNQFLSSAIVYLSCEKKKIKKKKKENQKKRKKEKKERKKKKRKEKKKERKKKKRHARSTNVFSYIYFLQGLIATLPLHVVAVGFFPPSPKPP